MAKFCTRCGRKLEKDEKCICEKIKKDKEKNINDNPTDLLSKITFFLKSPVEALNNLNFLEGNSYLMLLLVSISFGFINCLVPFGKNFRSFMAMTILSFIFFLLFSLIVSFVRNNIYKKNREYEDILKIVAISSIILLCGNIIAILFSYLSLIGVVVIISLSSLLFILYCYHGLLNLNDDDQNSVAYELTLGLLITAIIMSFILIIL